MPVLIHLDNLSKVYYTGQPVTGSVKIVPGATGPSSQQIESLAVTLEGWVSIIGSANPSRALELVHEEETLAVASTKPLLANNKPAEYRFSLQLRPKHGLQQPYDHWSRGRKDWLPETFHGSSFRISYQVKAKLKWRKSRKDIVETVEVFAWNPLTGEASSSSLPTNPYQEIIDPEDITQGKFGRGSRISQPNDDKVGIEWLLDKTSIHIWEPVAGEIRIHGNYPRIKSVELHLSCQETVVPNNQSSSNSEKLIKLSEIQTSQVCNGSPAPGLAIPLSMVIPRWVASSSLGLGEASFVGLAFQVSVSITFTDGGRLGSKKVDIEILS